MNKIVLSVHQIVDYVLRTGDIESRVFNTTTMNEGTRLHAIYQSRQGGNYIKEFNFSHTYYFEDYEILVCGRADGLILEDDEVIIDEIKTTNINLEDFHKQNEKWHLGQAIFYADMYVKEHNLDHIKISLTYLSQVDDSMMKKFYEFSKEELEENVEKIFRIYFEFEEILNNKKLQRNKSLSDLDFPFMSYRDGQKLMINEVKNTINNDEILFVEAATGIGKTMSTIYPTLEFLRNEKIDKVFYLCPKNSGFSNSLNALKILEQNNVKVSAVEIVAKEKTCPYHLKKECNPDDCKYARGYYSKVNDALKEVLISRMIISNELVQEYAEKYEICPFEFSLDLSLYVDYIICDLNYAFHPVSALKRFFEAPDKVYNNLALVDEAHNFIDRARDMYSASIELKEFKTFKKVYKKADSKSLKTAINKVNSDFKLFKEFEMEEGKTMVLETLDDSFILHLHALDTRVKDFKKENHKFDDKDAKDFLVNLYKFLLIHDLLNDGFKILITKEEDNIKIELRCIDPSSFLIEKLNNFRSSVLFSATFTPFDYFKKILLKNKEVKTLSIKSPFKAENFLLLVNNKISIKYKDRQKTINEVYKEVLCLIESKVGNYIIFVPSFEYLNLLKTEIGEDNRFIYQEKDMSKKEKEAFLLEFSDNPTSTKVGVCVIGGSFSEGVDLIGERLIGIAVIGIGLPQINFENDLIKDYYSENDLDGFEYAYINPGINKIMQAIGRVIRTENDKGVALLIDTRFNYKNYRETIFERWNNYRNIKNSLELKQELITFYKS